MVSTGFSKRYYIISGLLFGLCLFLFLKFICCPIIIRDVSLPYHFGIACRVCNSINKGDIIGFKKYFPDKYIPDDVVLIKKVACDSGDRLFVMDKVYYCNDKLISIAKDKDRKGNKVDNFKFNGVIPDGKLFVIGTNKDSYDSKYFGFIDASKIIYKIYPLL